MRFSEEELDSLAIADAKLDRQRATAAMPKCACGNVRPRSGGPCNACQELDTVRTDLIECETVEDLKAFIAAHLMKDM